MEGMKLRPFKMKLHENLMICEILNVALCGAAANCLYLDEPGQLGKIH